MSDASFPAASSVLSAAALLAEVVPDYAIGRPVSCELWASNITDTYAVLTDKGRYALRVYRAGWRTDDDVAYECDAVDHLAREGIRVAAPVARNDGRWFRVLPAAEGPRQVVLFAWAPGRQAHLEDGFSAAFGRALAEIHDATADFRSRARRFAIDLTELVDKPLTRLRPFLAHRPGDRVYLDDVAGRLRGRVGALISSGLDWGFCHGDAHGANAHLDDGTAVVFDFDMCGPGWRAYDLASFLWIWSTYDAAAAARHWDAFVRGYTGRRAIRQPDLAAIPVFVGLRHIWFLGLHTMAVPIRGRAWVTDAHLDRQLAFLRRWDQQHLSGT